MKEITRIHLAKTPYNIELEAKRQLEKYLAALGAFAGDDEVMADIELRMTELLSEYHISADGTITTAEVAALKKQLGSPEAFAGDDAAEAMSQPLSRRLYRDRSKGKLGGVASGLALYLGISVLWVRLAFILLAFASLGTVIVIYAVLWIVIPPVTKPSELLQLEGRPVTFSAIQAFGNVSFDSYKRRERQLARTVTAIVGVGLSLATFVALAATGIATYVALARPEVFGPVLSSPSQTTMTVVSLAAFVLSGLLLASLTTVGAYLAFSWKISRRILTLAGVIVVLGLTSFGIGVGTFYTKHQSVQAFITHNTKEETIEIPASFNDITSLNSVVTGAGVTYIVSQDRPKITIRQMVYRSEPLRPVVNVTGKTARITLAGAAPESFCMGLCIRPTITIYGPALDSLVVEKGSIDYQAIAQPALNIKAQADTNININRGSIENLTADLQNDANLAAEGASIKQANIKATAPSLLRLGVVQAIKLETPAACPSHSQANIFLEDVTNHTMTLNGQLIPASSEETSCLILQVAARD